MSEAMILALDVDVQLYYNNAALRAHHSCLGLAEANKNRQTTHKQSAPPWQTDAKGGRNSNRGVNQAAMLPSSSMTRKRQLGAS
jgi:hypothetical protein